MDQDVIIIGAGPIGLACGIQAKNHGLNYLIIEKGCIVNSIFHYPTNMTFFSTSERIELGNIPFVSHGIKPTRREALEYYRRVAGAYRLNIHTYEKVKKIEKVNSLYKTITDKGEYTSGFVILATGYYDNPNMMNIPGEDLPKVKHYFDEAHPYSGLEVAVIGAGNSAVDVALETYRTGAKVTMIAIENALKPGIKYWVKPDIENRISEGAIKAYFDSAVKEIKEKEILIETPGGEISLKNDFVFAMTGYHPDFDFLKMAGIDIDENSDPAFNEETFESNLKNIYLAGVVCGGIRTDKWFIENSIEHAGKIIADIGKKNQIEKQ
jgi:thioredoxin reductase (NADPH)